MIKPMLASPAPKDINFPVYASPKIDGIRAMVVRGTLLSRSFKPIPNPSVQKELSISVIEGLDGELTVGDPWDKNVMQKSAAVMRKTGYVPATFHVFDFWTQPEWGYETRLRMLEYNWHQVSRFGNIKLVKQTKILCQEQLDEYENEQVEKGYEGVMLRSLTGIYKYGRSTAKEGYLLKVKRWVDGEARIVDLKQFMHNANELEQDNFGNAKRATKNEGKVPMDMLGAFVCEDLTTGQPIDIGTGYTMDQRKDFWARRKEFQGKIVKYKHFAVTGVKDASRFPVFLGFRDPIDMGEPS